MPSQNHANRLGPCPAKEQLLAFSEGMLADELWEAVAHHVGSCERCEDVLQSLPESASELLTSLRELDNSRTAFEERSLERKRDEEPDWLTDLTRRDDLMVGFPPVHLREYRLLDRLGRGGMGTVYRAIHTRLDRVVAVKVLAAGRVKDAAALARFRREMRAVGQLRHDNIVQAHDAGEVDGSHFLVMEYLEGSDLSRLGTLRPADACEIVRQAAMGLQHAHEHGLVHRDVKPSNILLTRTGQVKLLDLGLALISGPTEGGEDATASGYVMGSFDYIAPEQGENPHEVDARADLYGLGCTLYYLLAGRPPYSSPRYATAFQKWTAHVQAPIPLIREDRPDVPEGLAAILKRLMAKKPEARFATATQAAAALVPFAAGHDLPRLLHNHPETLSLKTEPPRHDTAKGERRRWPRTLAAVLLIGILLTTAVYLIVKQYGSPDVVVDGSRNKDNDKQEGKEISQEAPSPAWFKKVAELKAADQVQEVTSELQRLNPRLRWRGPIHGRG